VTPLQLLAATLALIWLAGMVRYAWLCPWALLVPVERALTVAAILFWPIAHPLARFLDTDPPRQTPRHDAPRHDPTDQAGA
jgi:hypothetical protein